MKKMCVYLAVAASVGMLGVAPAASIDDLPPAARGTFVQRKVLADVNVTLVSKGLFRFEKGHFFEWDTREPVASVFRATPTNYAFTANGRTVARDLTVDVDSIKSLFAIKEMKEFVASIETDPPVGFPRHVRVAFKNGDRLEIDLQSGGQDSARAATSNAPPTPYRHVLVRDFRTVRDGQVINFNVGTAAHCPGTLAALKKNWPTTKFSVWADAPLAPELARLMARRFPEVKIYTGRDVPDTNADLLLVASGSGIAKSVRRSIVDWRARDARRPVAAYAIGYSRALKPTTETFDFCYFRDREALARAEVDGFSAKHGFAPDAVFDFDAADDVGAEALLAQYGLEPGRFVCAIPGHRFTPWWEFAGGKPDEARAAKNAKHEISDNAVVCAAIVEAVRTHGLKALLCAEQRTEMALASRALYDRLPPDVQAKCVVLREFWSPDLALGVYRRSRCVFGIEMHSQVMALGNGVPACVFRHSGFGTKSSMFRDVGAGEWLLDIDSPDAASSAAAMVGRILSDPDAARARCRAVRQNIDQIEERALKGES